VPKKKSDDSANASVSIKMTKAEVAKLDELVTSYSLNKGKKFTRSSFIRLMIQRIKTSV
jgi:hypothetical protein